MLMDRYNEKLEQVFKKVQQLASAHAQLKDDHKRLKAENEELLKLLKEQGEQIDDMEGKMRVLKVAKQLGSSPEEDRNELKKKINEYIKEIDKCVALLNN